MRTSEPSEFLKEYHKEKFPNSDNDIYSLEMFYKLLMELNEKSK